MCKECIVPDPRGCPPEPDPALLDIRDYPLWVEEPKPEPHVPDSTLVASLVAYAVGFIAVPAFLAWVMVK